MDAVGFRYLAVKGSLHATDSQVFGLSPPEVNAIREKCGVEPSILNGHLLKKPPITVINYLSELGYRVTCCSGEVECTWTMAREL